MITIKNNKCDINIKLNKEEINDYFDLDIAKMKQSIYHAVIEHYELQYEDQHSYEKCK